VAGHEQREKDRGGHRADDGLHGCAAHQSEQVQHRAQVADLERGLVTLEPDIGERALRAFLGSACQDRLELVLWHADEAVLWSLGCHGVPPSADLRAPKGRLVGGEVAVRGAEVALQFDGVAGGEGDHRVKPEGRRLRDMRTADLAQ